MRNQSLWVFVTLRALRGVMAKKKVPRKQGRNFRNLWTVSVCVVAVALLGGAAWQWYGISDAFSEEALDVNANDCEARTVTFAANGGNNTLSAPAAVEVNVTICNGLTKKQQRSQMRKDLEAAWNALYQGSRPGVKAFRVFDRQGRRVKSLSSTFVSPLYLLPSNEFFVWPGHYLGHVVEVAGVTNPSGAPVLLETVSLEPRAFVVENFVSDEEIEFIRSHSEPHMQRSQTYLPTADGTHENVATEDRTSEQYWLEEKTAIEDRLYKRLAKVMKMPHHLSYGGLQVLRYEPGQTYHAHYGG